MKKLYSLILGTLCSIAVFSQSTDKARLVNREMSDYSKMVGYNTNPNTQNYDLKYQRLDLSLDPASYYVSGSVTSHFVPKQSISEIYFDLTNVLSVSKVSYHGSDVPYQQLASKELKITLPAAVPSNALDSLTISFSGAPDSSHSAFTTSTQGGTPVLYTLSEPYGAQDWFPTKQSMDDKIDMVDIKITAPSQYTVGANGTLMSENDLGNGTKITFWRTKYPTAAYLVALGITNYTKVNSTIGAIQPFPYVNYIYPASNTSANTANIEWLKSAMALFENSFGQYPFAQEKYGQMQFGWGGGMEHQTMTSVNSYGKTLLAHELTHQWFGDKITCGTWNDIWLNEGFATFGEHLVNEKLILTNAQYLAYLKNEINTITASPGGSVYVADADLGNDGVIFSSRLSYAKGGYVVRMLKWVLGDDVFYSAIKNYLNNPDLAYKYAKTQDLKASLLASTGKDFTEFFNDWVYRQGYPTYKIRWNQSSDKSLVFNVNQTQSHSSVSFFEMPLPIKVSGANGETAYLVLDNTQNNQTFSRQVNFPVTAVSFNYEYQILEKNSTVTKDNTLTALEAGKEKFAVAVNENSGMLQISGIKKGADFKIFSVNGKLLNSGKFSGDIDVRPFVSGAYIITIGGQNAKFVKK